MTTTRSVAFLWCLVLLVVPTMAGAAAADRLAIVGGHLIDGLAGEASNDAVVLVEGDTITAIGGREIIPAGTRIIDLGAATILPGLIDTHVHPLMEGGDYQIDHLRLSSAYKALRGLAVVQRALEAGWTSLRTVGTADVYYAPVDVKRVIDQGLFQGIVIVRPEFNGFLIDIVEQFVGQSIHADLGITHRRSGITINRTEVTLAVDQRVAQRKILGHPHYRVINR